MLQHENHGVSLGRWRPAVAGGRFRGRVIAREVLGSLVWLTLQVDGWPGTRPGCFALLQAEWSAHFLARPLSIAATDGDQLSFLIAPIGPGTQELCNLPVDTCVWVLGPLGNGFHLDLMVPRPGLRVLLVGGGVGVAPFPLLLKCLAEASVSALRPREVVVMLGFRDGSQAEGRHPVAGLVAEVAAQGLPCRLVVCTEDGSVGEKGLVTDVLAQELQTYDHIAVCGPPPMSVAVWRLARAVTGTRSWFSLEAGMACGVGSCHGCVVSLADGSLARVCTEGPVFAGEDVWA